MRYHLERKEPCAMPNILGNKAFPVHTYRWRGIAASDDKYELLKICPVAAVGKDYRIVDTKGGNQ